MINFFYSSYHIKYIILTIILMNSTLIFYICIFYHQKIAGNLLIFNFEFKKMKKLNYQDTEFLRIDLIINTPSKILFVILLLSK